MLAALATKLRGGKQENDDFVKEQLDFANSIAACNRAVELLAAHYGDGSPKVPRLDPFFVSIRDMYKDRRKENVDRCMNSRTCILALLPNLLQELVFFVLFLMGLFVVLQYPN